MVTYSSHNIATIGKMVSDDPNIPDGVYKFKININTVIHEISVSCYNVKTFNELSIILHNAVTPFGVTVEFTYSGFRFKGENPAISSLLVIEVIAGGVDWLWANIPSYKIGIV